MCSATSGTTSLACLPMETATDLVSSRLTRLTGELRTCPRLLVEGRAESRALLAGVFRPDDVEVVGAAVDGDDLLVAQDEAHRIETVVGALLLLVVHPDAHAPAELLAAHRGAALVELLRLVAKLDDRRLRIGEPQTEIALDLVLVVHRGGAVVGRRHLLFGYGRVARAEGKRKRDGQPAFHRDPPTGRASGLLLGHFEHAREVDLVELDLRFAARLDLGLLARRLVGRLLEGVGELEAEGGERLRIGLFLVGDDGRAVDPRGEAHEDALGELDVRILRGRGGRFGGGGGGGGAHGRGPTAQSPRGTWISPRPAR